MGCWHRRDSTLVRWRGGVGPPLVALRRWRVLFEEARQQIALNESVSTCVLQVVGTGSPNQNTLSDLRFRPRDLTMANLPSQRINQSMRRPGSASDRLAGGTDGVQNHGRRTLDSIQRLSKRFAVTVIQMQIVTAGLPGIKPDRFADDEGHGFRFEFARVT